MFELLIAAVVVLSVQTAFLFIVISKASRANEQIQILHKILAAVAKPEDAEIKESIKVNADLWDAFNAKWVRDGNHKRFSPNSKEKADAFEKFVQDNK